MNSLSLRDRLLGWRDSVLSNPRFQRFAAVFPLMRPVARRRAAAMFDLVAGFVYSQILLACVQLRLFDLIAERPATVDELSVRCELPRESMQMLLDAAIALKLVQPRSEGRYGLGQLGAELCGNRGVLAMVEHHAMLYRDLADPVALLRGPRGGGELAAYWAYVRGERPAELGAEHVASYTALMAASQPMIAREVLHVFSFGAHRCLLDVGGGDGSFLSAVAAQTPELRCILFDLPAVAAKAADRFRTNGLAERATAIGGSFRTDPLPEGADIVSLVRVIHDHDDEVVAALLRAVHSALPERGTLLIAEPIAGLSRTASISDGYFAFYLRAMGTGKARTFEHLRSLLEAAGFAEIKLHLVPMPLVASVITATKTSKCVNLA
ncbi:hydroxyneurosporene-O-methyltransferase [Rhodopseudomonas palustris HaA2]|uniref:Hydroxyneurosporene-O-methyltransferase n=1 Tax=Rhodopseudomonas palustris (strain HaA2) TaxID=316058 RepID=Q2ISW4_RHOP2|nr:methyltransferase [Rhodopseudomonas palustris]ABD08696.1 hydroxyneurosporene-O-methyltransferase [Rhodopseudomonas palustris HaA2]